MSYEQITVGTAPPYPVHIGSGVLEQVGEVLVEAQHVFVLEDERVSVLHANRLEALDTCSRFSLPGGESAKRFAVLEEVLQQMVQAQLDRSSVLVTLGGGTIGDLGGLAASLFKRGIGVIHCPTTLLAQVDASVGGKTAINLDAGKNLVGTFHQPQAVFADSQVLGTLPEEELASGLGEVAKTALLGGETLVEHLETNAALLRQGEPEALAQIVRDCIQIKAQVVCQDPTEKGLRKSLNLGHTFGHAIEHSAGYGVIPHGVAVGVGLSLAARAGRLNGLYGQVEFEARITDLLSSLGLPTSLNDLRRKYSVDLPPAELVDALAHDKKGRVGSPEFVLLQDFGQPILGVQLEPEVVQELLN